MSRMKKISDGQAGRGVKLERNVNHQGEMKEVRAGFQGEVSRVLRESNKKMEESLAPRSPVGPDDDILGSRESQGCVGT